MKRPYRILHNFAKNVKTKFILRQDRRQTTLSIDLRYHLEDHLLHLLGRRYHLNHRCKLLIRDLHLHHYRHHLNLHQDRRLLDRHRCSR